MFTLLVISLFAIVYYLCYYVVLIMETRRTWYELPQLHMYVYLYLSLSLSVCVCVCVCVLCD